VTANLSCPSSVVEHTNAGGSDLFEADLQFLTCSGSASGDDFAGPERVYRLEVPEEYASVSVQLESCEASWGLWYQGPDECPDYQLKTYPCGMLLNGSSFDQYDTLLVGGTRIVWLVVEGYENDGGNFRLSVECNE
jgi:hypothetical protein